MFDDVKRRCGIHKAITVYDDDIRLYIDDAKADMLASGVPAGIVNDASHPGALTAVTLYVRAYLGDDRTDTEKYLDLYRKRVFRMTLEEDIHVE